MTAPTHIAFGNILMFCLAKVVGVPINLVTAGSCSFGACLPDIDTPTSGFGRVIFPLARWIEGRVGHRTLTHSLLGWVGFGIMFLPVLFFVKYEVYVALMIGIISHDIIDMVNTTGVTFLYPTTRRWVFPYVREHPTRYRIPTASGFEFVLLGVLVVLLGIFYPVGQFGFRRVLHIILGNPQGAVYDYRTIAAEYKIVADVKGIDRITAKHFSGRYPVVGALGNSTLIIRKEDGCLYTIGLRDETNFIPQSIRCKKGDRVTVITQEIEMGSRPLGDIKYFLDSTKEQYIYGSLKTAERVRIPYSFASFNTIFEFNGYLMFNIATWSDIEKVDITDVYVVNGKLIIKTLLKEGEVIKEIDNTTAEANKYNLSNVMSISFKVDKPAEVLVKKGDKIKEGQILAKTSIDDIEGVLEGLKDKRYEKAKVLQMKEIALSSINANIRKEEENLRKLRREEKDLKELVNSKVISQDEYQKNLDKQGDLVYQINAIKNQYAQENERYNVRLMELSGQIREFETKKEKLLASASPRSNVSGIVTDITFGPSASKMLVTVKILTDVNTVEVELDEEKDMSNHPSLLQGGEENHGRENSQDFRF